MNYSTLLSSEQKELLFCVMQLLQPIYLVLALHLLSGRFPHL